MPSQFFGLNIAYTGLVASNASLNTTANNISNVEKEGYSRQETVTQSADALRVFAKYGCAGAGVETLAVQRLKDEYYDVRYRNNNSNCGEFDVKSIYMKSIENYFTDDEYTTGFNTLFNNMFSGLEEVMKNAGDTTFKQAFVKDASSLTSYFNSMYDSLQTLQKDTNAEIKATADRINAYASQIATLTKQINVIEIGGGTANELRDERDLIVDKLSELVTVTAQESRVVDDNNPDRETGATNYVVKIAGGDILVKNYDYNELVCTARNANAKVNQTDADGLYDLKWSNGIPFDLNNASMGGKLRGLIDVRDGNNSEYFHGMVANPLKTIDVEEADGTKVTHQLVTVDVDASYLKDINKCTIAESGSIRLGENQFCYDSFNFCYDEAADKYTYEFVISDGTLNNMAVPNSACGKEASIGLDNGYQGIPYYMAQMSEWIRDFSQNFNEILTQQDSVDEHGNHGINLFVAEDKATNKQLDMTDYSPADFTGSYTISSRDNYYYKLTAGSFAVDKTIDMDASYLATHTVQSDGQDKYDIVEQLIDLQTNKDKMSFRGCSSSEFLQCVLADVALNANSANVFKAKYEDLGTEINNMRLSVSSVDNDEEAANLVKFQNAYVLASKMMSTFNEIYNRLILETGV